MILVCDDDPTMVELIGRHLDKMNLEWKGFLNPQLALENFDDSFEVLVTDLVMPEMSGLDLTKELRSKGSKIPVVMVTSKSAEFDREVALHNGIDFYLTKPFKFEEFQAALARVRPDLAG